MSERQRTPMSWNEFMHWEAQQSTRHEFVAGWIVAMTGGTSAHDSICNNLRASLVNRLRGNACRPHGPDMMVRTSRDNGRYPDALIDCGKKPSGATQASEPVAIFEVLSRGTLWIDQNSKFDDYDATPSVALYALIQQGSIQVVVYRRASDGTFDRRNAEVLTALDQHIRVDQPEMTIPLSELYEDVLIE